MIRARWIAALSILTATACFTPPEVDEGLFCDRDNDSACPAGQVCRLDGVCYWEYGEDDASPIDAPEAPIDAGAPPDAFDLTDCETALPCPDPAPDTVSVCGYLRSMRFSEIIQEDGADGLPCSGSESDGPCATAITFYDPLAFANDPATATPLVPAALTYDSCGRFAATSVPRPALGLLSLHVDDAPDRGLDGYVATARTFAVSPGQTVSSSFALAMTRALDAQWTTTAGDPFAGSTFSEVGVSVHLFLYRSEPTRNVTVTVVEATKPDDDYYFNDGDLYSRQTVEPLGTMTGTNGTALLVNSSAGANHGGTGAEPASCEWQQQWSGAIPGVVHYVEHIPVEPGTESECL